MKERFKVRNQLLALFGALIFIASYASNALAQCAMCRANAQASAGSQPAISEPLNLAILVLLIPPVLIFCAIFLVLLRYRKTLNEGTTEALDNARSL